LTDGKINSDAPWVIAEAKERRFATATEHLRQIVMMPAVTAVPDAPSLARGVIDLRGSPMPLVDSHVRLGMVSVVRVVAQAGGWSMSGRAGERRSGAGKACHV